MDEHVSTVVLVRHKNKQEIAPHLQHPRLKKHFFSCRNPMYLLATTYDQHQGLYVGRAYGATHRAATYLPVGIEGGRTHASTSLMRVSAGVVSRKQ